MTYTPDFSLLTETFSQISILGATWILPAILVVLSMAFLTRDIEQWKTLAFPMTVMWGFIMPINLLIYLVTGVIFVLDIINMKVISNWVRSTFEGKEKKEVKRMKEEIGKRKTVLQYKGLLDRMINKGLTKENENT